MSGHRAILAQLFKKRRLSHAKIAVLMGWNSAGTVGNKLRGERDWQSGELERMCELAGITLVALAGMSDDLKVTKTQEAVEAALIVDSLAPEMRDKAMQLLRSIGALGTD